MKKLMILGLSVLLMTACADQNQATESQPSTSEPTVQETVTETATEAAQSTDTSLQGGGLQHETFLSLEEAVSIFNNTLSNAKVEQIDLEYEGGSIHYDIQGFDETKEYEVVLDAKTGEVLKQEEDTESDVVESLVLENIIGFKEAMDLAITEKPDGAIEQVTLEMEMGKPVYKVEFEGDMDIKVPAEK